MLKINYEELGVRKSTGDILKELKNVMLVKSGPQTTSLNFELHLDFCFTTLELLGPVGGNYICVVSLWVLSICNFRSGKNILILTV